MSEEKSKRDALRSALLGKPKRISKIIEIAEGVEIEIRQPTVGSRSRIMNAAGVSASSQDLNDLAAIQIAAVVNCSFVPGTSERIFDAADRGVLEELPTNQWFDEVAGVALDLMNSEPEKAGKA